MDYICRFSHLIVSRIISILSFNYDYLNHHNKSKNKSNNFQSELNVYTVVLG